MKSFTLILISVLLSIVFFQGCSLKSPENQWEYNSSNAFNSYKKSFLINEEELAKSDLQRAIKYAKQSADLRQLSRIYLGVCALNISVGEEQGCANYKKIEALINSLELRSYFLMLTNKITKEQENQLLYLPKQYQSFAKYRLLKKYDLAFESIKSMEQISSQFIAASLIKKELKKSDINYLIKTASFYGYKKLVLFWLDNLYKIEDNLEKKNLILRKINILKI